MPKLVPDRRVALLAGLLSLASLGTRADATIEPSGLRTSSSARVASDVDFDRDILPILGARCLDCHSGPEPKARLDLLSRASATAARRGRDAAVVPGNAEASALIRALRGDGDATPMPPRGDPLTPEQVELLARWIDQGATWSARAEALRGQPWHWAWRAPVDPSPPQVANEDWNESGIDRFVFARLAQLGLSPSPPADVETLARRLSLTLTGLPADPRAVQAWRDEPSDEARERYVDALLDSPAYAEHMARLWMDLARYADTHGYEKDDRRSMWPWRDRVIESFRANLPYDRFTLEQLAGDLLPDADLDTRIASGFHRNTMINEEGGTDPEEFRVEAVHDRVHTTATVWMGATLACARCHDHKFDAFSIEDYYAFFAFFDDDRADATRVSATEQRASGATVAVAPPEQRERYAELCAQRDAARAAIDAPNPKLDLAQREWERARIGNESPWTVLKPERASAESGATLSIADDGTIEVSGPAAAADTYRIEMRLPAAKLRALRLEVLPGSDGKLGRAANGNFVLSEFGVICVKTPAGGGGGGPVRFARAHADHEQRSNGEKWLARDAVDGNPKTGWAVGGATDVAHELVLEAGEPFDEAAGATLKLTLAQRFGSEHNLARFRLSASASEDSARLTPIGATLRAALATAESERGDEQRRALREHYRAHAPGLAEVREQLETAEAELATISTATTMVMEAAAMPRTTRVLRKGNFLDPGEVVEPRLPRIFRPMPEDAPRNRLGLAKWLVSDANPQFARVFVNHVWAMHFGRGLVATHDDFGTQGEAPSHPELLDWLAQRFAKDGYDVRALHRRIVGSRTYRQASSATAAAFESDPHNARLTRGPRHRLDAEVLRDSALAASGLLARRVGGPSVFPPQPPGIWTMIYSSDRWIESTGEDRYRRGMYTFARRTAPYPSFATFDAPSREVACTRRARTNTPLQALTLLNDPQFVEAAVALGRRMQREGGSSDADAIDRGFALCLAREPSAVERNVLLELLRSVRERFAANPESAQAWLANLPDVPRDDEPDRTAALGVVANVLLNLDAFQCVE